MVHSFKLIEKLSRLRSMSGGVCASFQSANAVRTAPPSQSAPVMTLLPTQYCVSAAQLVSRLALWWSRLTFKSPIYSAAQPPRCICPAPACARLGCGSPPPSARCKIRRRPNSRDSRRDVFIDLPHTDLIRDHRRHIQSDSPATVITAAAMTIVYTGYEREIVITCIVAESQV